MAEQAKSEHKPKPSADDLPSCRIIWVGNYPHLDSTVPCRVVLFYEWWRRSEKADWEIRPDYGFEVGRRTDLIGVSIYEREPLNSLPPEFFQDVIKAFDRVK